MLTISKFSNPTVIVTIDKNNSAFTGITTDNTHIEVKYGTTIHLFTPTDVLEPTPTTYNEEGSPIEGTDGYIKYVSMVLPADVGMYTVTVFKDAANDLNSASYTTRIASGVIRKLDVTSTTLTLNA